MTTGIVLDVGPAAITPHGVAPAAIQGPHRLVVGQDAESAARRSEVDSLESLVTALLER